MGLAGPGRAHDQARTGVRQAAPGDELRWAERILTWSRERRFNEGLKGAQPNLRIVRSSREPRRLTEEAKQFSVNAHAGVCARSTKNCAARGPLMSPKT